MPFFSISAHVHNLIAVPVTEQPFRQRVITYT